MSATTHVRCLTLPSHPCPPSIHLFTTFHEIHPMVDCFSLDLSRLQCRFLAEHDLLLKMEQFIALQPPKPQSTLQMHNEESQAT